MDFDLFSLLTISYSLLRSSSSSATKVELTLSTGKIGIAPKTLFIIGMIPLNESEITFLLFLIPTIKLQGAYKNQIDEKRN